MSKTPLQKLIDRWNKQLIESQSEEYKNTAIYATSHAASHAMYTQFIKEAESLLAEEKQMVIYAYLDGDEDCHNKNKRTGKEYFQEKYES